MISNHLSCVLPFVSYYFVSTNIPVLELNYRPVQQHCFIYLCFTFNYAFMFLISTHKCHYYLALSFGERGKGGWRHGRKLANIWKGLSCPASLKVKDGVKHYDAAPTSRTEGHNIKRPMDAIIKTQGTDHIYVYTSCNHRRRWNPAAIKRRSCTCRNNRGYAPVSA